MIGKQIFHTIFSNERHRLGFLPYALADIERDGGRAEDVAPSVFQRRDGKRDLDLRSVLSKASAFEADGTFNARAVLAVNRWMAAGIADSGWSIRQDAGGSG